MFVLRVLLVLDFKYCSNPQYSEYLGLQYCSYSEYSGQDTGANARRRGKRAVQRGREGTAHEKTRERYTGLDARDGFSPSTAPSRGESALPSSGRCSVLSSIDLCRRTLGPVVGGRPSPKSLQIVKPIGHSQRVFRPPVLKLMLGVRKLLDTPSILRVNSEYTPSIEYTLSICGMLVRRSVRTDDDCYGAFYDTEKSNAFEPRALSVQPP